MRIVFTGDLSASGNFYHSIRAGKPIWSDEIANILNQADFVHVNLENPITDRDFRLGKKGAALKAPIELVDYLTGHHVNICDLANNHIMDCGEEGLEDTIALLQKNRISYYGVGKYHQYLTIEHEDVKVALIASSHKEGPMGSMHQPGPYHFSEREAKEIIDCVKAKVDYIVYNFHGGTEFNVVPEPQRRRFFHELIGYGVDIVIGHHAHVPQGYEQLESGIIFYGMGNFIFDLAYHRSKAFTNTSFVLCVDIEKNREIQFEQHYYLIDFEEGKVCLLEDDALRTFIERKTLVFENEERYRQAWLEEAFRVYLCNVPIQVKGFSPSEYLQQVDQVQRKNCGDLRLAGRMILDVKRPNKRPFLVGSIQKILKYGA